MKNTIVKYAFMVFTSLILNSCNTVPLTESDNYAKLKGNWKLILNTYDDAPWPDSRYYFSEDGYLYIYHDHIGDEYLAGTFKLFFMSSAKFRSRFYDAGKCNDIFHNSDWPGDGTVMRNWYELINDNKLKMGWSNSQGIPLETGYLIFERED